MNAGVTHDREPIAVVGVSCRLPGAPDPDAFWRLLRDGTEAVTEIPDDRAELRAAGPDGTLRRGGFLRDVDLFDAGFFGISAGEAAAMDPQQRLVLELSWEALEDAGIVPGRLAGGHTGVFVGAMADDYAVLAHRRGLAAVTAHTSTGLHRSFLANRVSHALGIRGPSVTVDTGQSSSLTAVHLACESLHRGEAKAALVAGVQLNLAPQALAGVERLGALSPHGRCRTFDAGADGYVRGEGGAVLVLKPLTSAEADGNRIYCVLRGSALNNGGSTELTVPDRRGQADVLRRAYRSAGVDPGRVTYVELHGTGTPVGDPVEAAALGDVLGRAPGRAAALRVGSAKTNVGHLESAAGIVGLLKVALSLHHRQLPPSLNFTTPNDRIPLDDLGLRVQTGLTDWGPVDARIAGVSAFGMGGTNCHVVVQGHAQPDRAAGPARELAAVPWPVSGASPAALREQARRLSERVRADRDLHPADVGRSLSTDRTHFSHRPVVVASEREGLLAGLDAIAAGAAGRDVVQDVRRDRPVVAFLFPGQGSQRAGMGRELYAAFPGYAASFDRVCAQFDRHLPRPLREVVFAEQGSAPAALLDDTRFTQPALFAVGVAIADLLRGWGVHPDFAGGHSIGELTAAYVSGVFSLPDACRLVADRARLMASVRSRGAMLALATNEDRVYALMDGLAGPLSLAAANGPDAVVVSGDADAIAEVAARAAAAGHKTHRLPVSHAFHSAHMDPILDEFARVARDIDIAAPGTPLVSNLLGEVADPRTFTDPGYWARHIREPVRFADGVADLRARGVCSFAELGPGGALSGIVEQNLGDEPATTVVALLHKGFGEAVALTRGLSRLHTAGVPVDWAAYFAGTGARRVCLPTYAFQRQRYWLADEPAASTEPQHREAALEQQLAGRGEQERTRVVHQLVREEVALVAGGSPQAVAGDRIFKDLGFDSLMTVELRNRLRARTGMALPSTLLFSHPTPDAVAGYLLGAVPVTADPEPAAAGEPIAVVAASCRFPGGVKTPEQLWDMVLDGREAITGFPLDRGWRLTDLLAEDGTGASHASAGGFLHDAGDFDAAFFGISPREALAMDPQQRLLLECAWELFERATIDPSSVRGTAVGTFVGATAQDYGPRLHEATASTEGHVLTGTTPSIASGRLAYVLGLRGPALTVDTACSSSLVAMHLAVQALRNGDCTMAIAGGVTVMSGPGMFTEFSRQHGLAADGRCKPFAAAADGTAWSEGAGLVLLEPLAAAREHGHPVLAVLRGTAINSDGASNGLTAPNGLAQEQVIRQALANARLRPDDIDAVEAHGTGTTLGDPIEAQALLATYGRDRDPQRPVRLGSLKSNIGHTQAAAGVAGVIKMIEALRHGILPRTLNVDVPSPHVDWSTGGLALVTDAVPWPANGRRRRAAVSSFGISGTNAHVIIEEAEAPAGDPAAPDDTGAPVPLVLSAQSEAALSEQAARLRRHLTQPWRPVDVGYSLATARSSLAERAVLVAEKPGDVGPALDRLAQAATAATAATAAGLYRGRAAAPGPVAFMLSGQGSQRPGMGRELSAAYPVFAEALDEVCAHLDPHLGRPLRDVMFAEPGSADAALLDTTAFTQPALFAFHVALCRLAAEFGVRPDYLIGHSVGEISAACLAGVLSLADACELVAARGRLMENTPADGVMVAVQAAQEEVVPLLEGREAFAGIAAVNGPRATVVSGSEAVVLDIAGRLAARGHRTRRLRVARAFHSPHMDGVLDEFRQVARRLTYRPARLPVVSNVTGRLAEPGMLDSPDYWVGHIRRPVLFHHGIRGLDEAGVGAYVEIGPDAALVAAAGGSLGGGVPVVFTQRRDRPEAQAFLGGLAELHVCGMPVSWTAAFAGRGPRRVTLPTYAFQRRRFWQIPPGAPATLDHPLLDNVVESAADGSLLLTGRLSAGALPWLAEHVVLGRTLLPGAVFVELALFAAARRGCDQVGELTLQAPLLVPERSEVELQVAVGAADGDGRRPVSIHSRAGRDQDWTRHATGTAGPAGEAVPVPAGIPADAVPLDTTGVYDELAARAYAYGPAFQCLTAAWQVGDDIVAELTATHDGAGFVVDPLMIDAALHAVLGLAHRDEAGVRIPFAWTGITAYRGGARKLRVWISAAGRDTTSLTITDESGTPVLSVRSLAWRPVTVEHLAAGALYQVTWTEIAPGAADPGPLSVVTLDGDRPVAQLGAIPRAEPPAYVVAGLTGDGSAGDTTRRALHLVQRFLADDGLAAARLVVVTRHAIATSEAEDVTDLAAAGVWGLIRSAQAEHPGRLVIVDSDATPGSEQALHAALRTGEPQFAIRAGRVLVPQLAPGDAPAPPAQTATWRLQLTRPGSLDNVVLAPGHGADRALGDGEVRVAVRAAGLNFRDVLIALGAYPGAATMGAEGAGIVTEVGPGVPDLRAGDRVMGLMPGTIAARIVVDHRYLVPVPPGWSFAQAAGVPVAFLTAYYGLTDVAGVKEGEKVLVHAATGGVGMAAVQLAGHLGAEVFGTAAPAKWPVLRGQGVADDHLASSRTLDFETAFRATTDGHGVDVVLNSLAREFTDASLRLTAHGGRFVELGKTDVRAPGEVADLHPGVTYTPFDLLDVAPDRIRQMLADLVRLFADGRLRPLPVTACDVRHAGRALRRFSQAQHTGKLVLTFPAPPDPDGTAVVVGGTGALGRLVAEHLVKRHGLRRLLLISRSGAAVPNADELRELGAVVSVAACDAADPDALAAAFDAIPAGHPPTVVVHAAGVVADGTVASLTDDQVEAVFHAKADPAWSVHRITERLDLAALVFFSSAVGVLGNPGQANYAAANTYLDALAHHRRTRGLPAVSAAWGPWDAGMAGALSSGDRAAMARTGMAAMPTRQALALLDVVLTDPNPLVVPVNLTTANLRAGTAAGMLRRLAPTATAAPARTAPASRRLGLRRLTDADEATRGREALTLVRTVAAEVLGHSDPGMVAVDRGFLDGEFDSLSVMELRNRLAEATGLRLPNSLTFDYPTPAAVAAHLADALAPPPPDPAGDLAAELDRLETLLAAAAPATTGDPEIAARLRRLLRSLDAPGGDAGPATDLVTDVAEASHDELFAFIDEQLGPR